MVKKIKRAQKGDKFNDFRTFMVPHYYPGDVIALNQRDVWEEKGPGAEVKKITEDKFMRWGEVLSIEPIRAKDLLPKPLRLDPCVRESLTRYKEVDEKIFRFHPEHFFFQTTLQIVDLPPPNKEIRRRERILRAKRSKKKEKD